MLTVFNELFTNEDDSAAFNKVMNWKFSHIFSDTGGNVYNVSYLQARSIINPDGKYRQILTDLDALEMFSGKDKSSRAYHIQGLYLMAHMKANGSLQKLMNLLKEMIKDLQTSEISYRKVFYKWDASMDWSKHD